MNAAWDKWVSAVTPPTRVCVKARMAQPHERIELLRSRRQDREDRQTSGRAPIESIRVQRHNWIKLLVVPLEQK